MALDPLRLINGADSIIYTLAKEVLARTQGSGIWIGQGKSNAGVEHRSGRALDIIVSSQVGLLPGDARLAAGNALANWLASISKPLHVRHIIWNKRIYRTRYSSWGTLPGRTTKSSISDWHQDHIHIWLEDSRGTIPSSSVQPPPSSSPSKPAGLKIDGVLGPESIKRWQAVMGTYVDGVISTPKSALVMAVQRKLNSSATGRDWNGRKLIVDGEGIASNINGRYPSSGRTRTVYALQRYLASGADGALDNPSAVIKKLQERLNAGWF